MTDSLFNLRHEGRKALVTGAASGIGAAIAAGLAETGAHIYAVDLNEEGLTTFADNTPGDIEPIACDLSVLENIASLPTDVDILVNNAGIQNVQPVHEFPLEKFEFMMRLMLHAPYYLIRQSLPHMYERGWGRIINVSSAHGLRASAFKSAYVTAKHGMEGLSKTVALEGAAHGVTSNCINPGYVRTPLVEKQIADQAKVHGISENEVVEKIMLERSAVKRLLEPKELADAAVFLTSDSAASMSGVNMILDGGWTAH